MAAIRTRADLVRAVCTSLGSLSLRSRHIRALLNRHLNSYDFITSQWIDRFFADAQFHTDFLWSYQFRGTRISLPVERQFPKSWHIAVSMYNHEPLITRFWAEYLSLYHSGVFFDVGANYGIHSYRFLSHGYRCVLFEPQRECTRFISRVCSLNGWAPSIIEQVVAECAQTIRFYHSKSTWFSSLSPEWILDCGEEPVEVEKNALSLDDYCANTGLFPTVIKIDIEGGEARALRGAQNCLALHHPALVIEVLRSSGNRADVWNAIVPHGYSAFAVAPATLKQVQTRDEFLESDSLDFVFADTPLA